MIETDQDKADIQASRVCVFDRALQTSKQSFPIGIPRVVTTSGIPPGRFAGRRH